MLNLTNTKMLFKEAHAKVASQSPKLFQSLQLKNWFHELLPPDPDLHLSCHLWNSHGEG